jgi:hypothetical protein
MLPTEQHPGQGILKQLTPQPLAPSVDIEQQRLLAALHQPLFLQAPLQGLLEQMVQRTSASTITQGELLARISALEVRIQAPVSSATPFAVSQLAARMAGLEAAAARLEEDTKQLKFQSSEVRLQSANDLFLLKAGRPKSSGSRAKQTTKQARITYCRSHSDGNLPMKRAPRARRGWSGGWRPLRRGFRV